MTRRDMMMNELRGSVHHAELTPEESERATIMYIELSILKSRQAQAPFVAELKQEGAI